ncbi:MAG: RIP metalloprotease RseP [Candidatus Omnitrophota bacterium]|jgi:regulator of sigma E protease
MTFLTSLVPALVVLGFLIIVHEFGHFLACRLNHIKVDKFSIGFGPEIFHWQGRETRYAISLLPLGGFVKPAGEIVSELEGGSPKAGDYLGATVWARMIVVVAGVAMNYLFAYVLFAALFLSGRPVAGTVIGGFVEGYPAAVSGLAAGDRIVAVDASAVRTWKDLTDALDGSSGGGVRLTVARAGREIGMDVAVREENVQDVFGHPAKVRRIGIVPNPEAVEFERHGLPGALRAAWESTADLTVMTHKAIYYLILGKLSVKNISGPIGIINMTGAAAHLGLPYVLQLMAILSISLAVINLLPVPALDGGHFLFLLVEAVTRRRVSLKVQEWLTQAGFILLLMLMAFILYNDLVNIKIFEKLHDLWLRLSPIFGGR